MQEPLNGGSLGNRRCSYEQSLFYFIEARFHYFDFTGVSCQIPYTIIFPDSCLYMEKVQSIMDGLNRYNMF